MKRRNKESPFKKQSLPFTQEVRNFVYAFLDREEMNINEIFTTVQGKQNVDNDTFPAFVESFRYYSFGFVDTFEDMLAYCTALGQISLLVYKNGTQLAPSIALVEISDLVKAYISTRSENSFWQRLGMKPQLRVGQLASFCAEVETADTQSARGCKLQMLINHLEKQTKVMTL
ncbi:hypothetical protein TNCT_727771 [Trichonephila clavata]|uniref:Uncharacterized protein n=1 Tax=Trichonephila clavata TaxID=2740835 RepID=A0A8X6GBU2_TRICU|nr:hypothetical protein TNCT_727771 [Trichonephila clavata]